MAITERYSIRDVEQLTGITAYTLRAWEKRYGVFLPHRSETNIRYYDGEQLRGLLNVASLVGMGHKVSRVMAMDKERVHELMLLATEKSSDLNLEVHINNLVAAMLSFDEPAFDKILSSMIIRLGLYDAVLQVAYPFLRKTGVLWRIGNTSPAQEHFASNLLRRKLEAVIDAMPCPTNTNKKFLLFLPPDERHEMGLLLSNYIIRSRGEHTVYLGKNLPYESLRQAMSILQPTHLLTFFTAGMNAAEHLEIIMNITGQYDCKVLVSGSTSFPEMSHPQLVFLAQPHDLLAHL